ncbi:pyridoxal-phosphate-dependent aminotransferase family protein [Methanospirillum stamsii]|uniref:Aminotransferase n=1 Tax=Methanospirillum stamsii TaxID=1277351 RepID=A0A2V2N3H1_9EURY|nr:alanine--glyoxylate aminotransferase family protein [Methanospirillum stamsii]PWR71068.1 aminotransferase [Methanospirillum stamsii]
MEDETLLMLPGPVPMPERVRSAMARQAINHRGAEFGNAYADIVRVLKGLFGTKNNPLVISGSGTSGMEAAVSNFGKGRKMAHLINGKFGERMYTIGQRYASEALPIESEWGTPLNLEKLTSALEDGVEVVTMVHNETSAGILNPGEEVGKICRKHDALFIMDGVTSIGGDVFKADDWFVDVAIVGSQKCLAAPAGLAAVSVSDRAWDRVVKNPPYYLDLPAYKKNAAKDPMETPYTPAVPIFLALREACLIIEEEGIENRISRHHKMAKAVRSAVAAWGVDMFPKTDAIHQYSNTVTAACIPANSNDKDFRGSVKKFGIQIAGGQDHLKDKIFRIGHMGAVSAPELLATIAATEYTIRKTGHKVTDSGVMAAAEVLG